MINKLFSAFFAGVFFTFFLDFFLMLGIFLNYIKAHDIDVYYNILFADNQSLLLYLIGVIVFGYLFVFLKNTKIAAIIFAVCFAVVNLTQIPSIGKSVGEMILEEKNQIISKGKTTYIGTIIYEGRDTVWFHDDELGKIITFKRNELSE